MGMQGNSVVMAHVARATSARPRFGFVAVLLSLLMFAVGTAQASPEVANYYLQSSKSEFNAANSSYQIGRKYALAGNVAAARAAFRSANAQTVLLLRDSYYLQSENFLNLQTGMYRNLDYQQMAARESDLLNKLATVLNAYINTLAQNPANADARANADMLIAKITVSLYYTEKYMTLAQN